MTPKTTTKTNRRRHKVLRRARLTYKQILEWAKEHHARTGRWPNDHSGQVIGHPGESWQAIKWTVREGLRGLPGGDTLPRLLQRRLGAPIRLKSAPLSYRQIREWARIHRERFGKWPTDASGPVFGVDRETWGGIDAAMQHGYRGLPGGTSLASFLGYNRLERPPLTIKLILECADEHHRRTGRWPTAISGRFPAASNTTWTAINVALTYGLRGLRGGSSVAQLLAEHRGVPIGKRVVSTPNLARLGVRIPKLSVKRVLASADAYFKKNGRWPNQASGPVPNLPFVSWYVVNEALKYGRLGLPARWTLNRLLSKHRGTKCWKPFPPLSEEQILAWAEQHHWRTGTWPTATSGVVFEAPELTWQSVSRALTSGTRSLPGGSTLYRLLSGVRGPAPPRRPVTKASAVRRVRPRRRPSVSEPPQRKLAVKEIVMWARAHHRRTGEWPERYTGRISDAPGETWLKVDDALRQGTRGLPGGSSLEKLLARRRKPDPIFALLAKLATRGRRV